MEIPFFAVKAVLNIRSFDIVAHATTVQLLWHIQNYVTSYLLQFAWEQNEIGALGKP